MNFIVSDLNGTGNTVCLAFPSVKQIAANGKHTIPAVNNAVELLRLLADQSDQTTTKALALRLRIPRTTCYRILRSLVARDWVRIVDGGRHELSLGLLPLLRPLRPVEGLGELVQPALENLAARTGLTAKVSLRQGDSAITIARCESPRETSVAVRLGASFHLAFGSSGAVLLSGLEKPQVQQIIDAAPDECWAHQAPKDVHQRLKELAKQGWCADFGTFRASCHAISAPLHDMKQNVLAAMTIIGFPHELTRDRQAAQVKLLLDAARQAEKALRQLSGKARGRTGGHFE